MPQEGGFVLTTSTSATGRRAAWLAGPLGWALLLALSTGSAGAQDAGDEQGPPAPEAAANTGAEGAEDALNKALDSTATQWSFQLAWQMMPDYHNDTMSNGQTRPDGATDYLQLRIVAPLPFEKLTILPRVTLRHYENPQGDSGMGNTEIFALMIPKKWDWGSGRTGIGPLVTLPGNEKVARDEWGYGFAAAVVNSSGPWYYGLLFTQTWRAVDPTSLPPTSSDTNPLGIAPFLNFQLGGGFYVGNGDMVARYDWDTKQVYLPIGIRVGKVFVKEKGSWNAYFEYQTSLIYKDWLGSAVKNSYRFNVTYTMPIG
jgi:hypothetical protein